jgi:hypothetical protein
MSIDRTYRHLCPEADMRDAMTDDEFWEHVLNNLVPPYEEPEIDGPDIDVQMRAEPCTVCGEAGACGYDAEGRALIHAIGDEDVEAT